jgi:MFS family permease
LCGLGCFSSLSHSELGFGIAALVYGLGFGAAYPVIGALVADNSSSNSRGFAFGIYAGGFDLGLIIGSLLGGVVGAVYGPQSLFILVAILILLGLLGFYLTSPERRRGAARTDMAR